MRRFDLNKQSEVGQKDDLMDEKVPVPRWRDCKNFLIKGRFIYHKTEAIVGDDCHEDQHNHSDAVTCSY